jgi:hypothetical protein
MLLKISTDEACACAHTQIMKKQNYLSSVAFPYIMENSHLIYFFIFYCEQLFSVILKGIVNIACGVVSQQQQKM